MTPSADTVGIVGAGSFGTALATLVASQGRGVVIYSQTEAVAREINEQRTNEVRLPGAEIPRSVRATTDPQELTEGARFIVVAVAAADVRGRARALGDHLHGGHILVHAVGSLTEPDDERVSNVLGAETPVARIGVLAGPALPRDLLTSSYASMVCASEFDEVTREARRLLAVPPKLRLYQGRDLVGVELSAALAGAYTVALGLADGLGIGPGPRSTLVTRAVAEGSRICSCAGAEHKTFTGLAGLGNLMVRSATSNADSASSAYRYGHALGSEHRPDGPLPVGARAALALLRLAERQGERAPVLRAVVAVINGTHSALEAAAMAADTVADEE